MGLSDPRLEVGESWSVRLRGSFAAVRKVFLVFEKLDPFLDAVYAWVLVGVPIFLVPFPVWRVPRKWRTRRRPSGWAFASPVTRLLAALARAVR